MEAYALVSTDFGIFGFVARDKKIVQTHLPRTRAAVKRRIVEAFPNAYLGVCLSGDVYDEMPKLRRGGKFDWLYDCWVKRGLFRRVVGEIGLDRFADLGDEFDRNKQHDQRAALVCLLTAASVFSGHYTAVGNEAGGYFFLPSWQGCTVP